MRRYGSGFADETKQVMPGMRDKRFVTLKRGGTLTPENHIIMMRWSCACVDRLAQTLGTTLSPVLAEAMRVAEDWAGGKVKTGAAMSAARAVHVHARSLANPVDKAFARAVGHAVATAHMADHCIGPVLYSEKAVKAAGGDSAGERKWQFDRLPPALVPALTDLLNVKTRQQI